MISLPSLLTIEQQKKSDFTHNTAECPGNCHQTQNNCEWTKGFPSTPFCQAMRFEVSTSQTPACRKIFAVQSFPKAEGTFRPQRARFAGITASPSAGASGARRGPATKNHNESERKTKYTIDHECAARHLLSLVSDLLASIPGGGAFL